MQSFKDLELIKKIDPQNTLGSTDMILEQCKGAWEQVNKVNVPGEYKDIANIVFCGMGASIYGALVVKALLGANFPYPTEIITDYHLPCYVSTNSLVVLTSYSGSTEEVLSCAKEAKEKNAKILVLSKGGKLAEFAKINNVPSYIFDGVMNPAGIPRLGCGYSILGLIGLLNKAGITNIGDIEIKKAIDYATSKLEIIKTRAMSDANIYTNKIPIIIAAEHLSGNAQILRNQFNETSKTFSAYYLVPDLNHHLMEGLQFPSESKLDFVVLNSTNYSPKISKRVQLTKEVINQNKHAIHEYITQGKNVYDDFMEMLVYGNYLTLYLALMHDQNPAVNPWVDYFKKELA